MIRVEVPAILSAVSAYTAEYIFGHSLNAGYEIVETGELEYTVSDTESGNSFSFPASFVSREADSWLNHRSPESWGLHFNGFGKYPELPVLFEDDALLPDYFGTIFFFLNRYPEQVEETRADLHNRIRLSQSFPGRNNLHTTPWADVYLQLFTDRLNRELGTEFEINGEFDVLPSHDVDRPFEFLYYSPWHLMKRTGGDLLVRKNPAGAFERIRKVAAVKSGQLDQDPYNTFQWIMEASEKAGRQSTFHFITENTNSEYDQLYDLDRPEIQQLLTTIYDRGHCAGLHPSYESSMRRGQVQKEADKLKKTLLKLDITQDEIKSRNHFLRWQEACFDDLQSAGIQTDQTLGFAEEPGFRCGTCRSFRPFNFQENKAFEITEEPLMLMEVSLFNSGYMNLGSDLKRAWDQVSSIKEHCKTFKGQFTVLWHNNNLITDEMKAFYQECIK